MESIKSISEDSEHTFLNSASHINPKSESKEEYGTNEMASKHGWKVTCEFDLSEYIESVT